VTALFRADARCSSRGACASLGPFLHHPGRRYFPATLRTFVDFVSRRIGPAGADTREVVVRWGATDLVRVIEPVAELTRIWRLLKTPELRHTPRVAAFFNFIVSEIDTPRPIIAG